AIPLARWWHQEDRLAQILWLRGSLRQQPVARQFLLQRLRPEDAVDTVENQIQLIQAPTLVIAAEEDDTIPLWHCQTYAERIPEAQLKILPAASHAIPAFHAESVLPLIQEFLSSISTSISTTNAIKKTTARYQQPRCQQRSQQPVETAGEERDRILQTQLKGGLPLRSSSG
ncbi:MAG: alpha/beta hydrolase, partial [Cyanobacteriota bacterium]